MTQIQVTKQHHSINLLIGPDIPVALAALEIRCRGNNEPHAVRTIFGWSLNGPISAVIEEQASSNYIHADCRNVDERLEVQVERFWK